MKPSSVEGDTIRPWLIALVVGAAGLIGLAAASLGLGQVGEPSAAGPAGGPASQKVGLHRCADDNRTPCLVGGPDTGESSDWEISRLPGDNISLQEHVGRRWFDDPDWMDRLWYNITVEVLEPADAEMSIEITQPDNETTWLVTEDGRAHHSFRDPQPAPTRATAWTIEYHPHPDAGPVRFRSTGVLLSVIYEWPDDEPSEKG